jgi:hypothetical protein
MSARVVQRHVLDAVAGDDLRVYVVWGPMLGKETEADARGATVSVPDPRAIHFWTDAHGVAEAFQAPLGLADTRAWDTFLLFPPGERWTEAAPRPSSFMHVGKPLPKERRLNGETLAREVRAALEVARK